MKVLLGSDKSGFSLKEAIKEYLIGQNYEVEDLGTQSPDAPMPFFKTAPIVAEKISSGEAERGILICGTGMGMSQVANKYPNVRAAVVESTYSAKMCRAINDSNILALGGWVIAPELGIEMVKAFLQTEFTQDLEEWRQEALKGAKKEFAALEKTIYAK
ncbi:RpiB/LacA/LacB family sugar-phosphate isomerase [Oscillospiraceae bacterium MB08-C2-2]|nr:RpiB/LacA/LacB family sugar-phosphate isomerase [Oscillospiraceae bacterium MB08-C2-2]